MQGRIASVIALLIGIAAVPVDSLTRSLVDRPVTLQGGRKVTVPAGTRILIRTSDDLNPTKQKVGQRFGGKLETNLLVGDVIVAPRDTPVLGQLTTARTGGKVTGGSLLELELTEILIGGTPHPISTNTFDVQSRGIGDSGRTKAEKAQLVAGVGLGALLGGVIGIGRAAGAGVAAGTGAVAAATGKQELTLPSGTLVEFRLEKAASIPIARQ